MKALSLHIGLCLAAAGLFAAPAAQADDGVLGNDVSWPQCASWAGVGPAETGGEGQDASGTAASGPGTAATDAAGTGTAGTGTAGAGLLPEDSAFVVVGVNNGMPGTANPCLQSQLGRAQGGATTAASTGRQQNAQIPVSLYLNTGISAPDWPTSADAAQAPSRPVRQLRRRLDLGLRLPVRLRTSQPGHRQQRDLPSGRAPLVAGRGDPERLVNGPCGSTPPSWRE